MGLRVLTRGRSRGDHRSRAANRAADPHNKALFERCSNRTASDDPLVHARRLALLLVGAVFAALNAVLFMTVEGHGSVNIRARMLDAPILGWTHTMGGALAALIGPFQFLSVIRNRYRPVHVWLGRFYLLCVLASGLAGLYFALMRMAGSHNTRR